MKNSERDIFDLLKSLKNVEKQYPPDLMQSRREIFARQAASAAIAIHATGKSPELSGSSQTAASATSFGSSLGTLLEAILIIAIVVEAGIATYIFRDKIADLIGSIISPRVEQVANPTDASPSSPEIAPATKADTTPSASPTDAGTTTPLPSSGTLPAVQQNNNTGGSSQITSTPDPNGNNGLHLGQTKQPTEAPKSNKEPKYNDNTDSNTKNNESNPNNKKNK